MKELPTKVIDMPFNVSKLVDTVSQQEVDTLADITDTIEFTKSQCTDEQMVEFAYFILQQVLKFKLDLKV
eukprot:6627174-Ditylum_brightwellii.AAC.1